MSNGKGDQPRPLAVPVDEYGRRWKATFQRTPMTSAPLADIGTVQQIATNEPYPSGGRKVGE